MAVDNKVGEPVKKVPDAATLFKQLSGGAYGELLTGELGVSFQKHVSSVVLHDDFEQKDRFSCESVFRRKSKAGLAGNARNVLKVLFERSFSIDMHSRIMQKK